MFKGVALGVLLGAALAASLPVFFSVWSFVFSWRGNAVLGLLILLSIYSFFRRVREFAFGL
jgi:hypothetical protein